VDRDGGWIKLYRSIRRRGILADGPLWQVLGWAVLSASLSRRRLTIRGVTVEIERGEVAYTQAELGVELKLTPKQVRGALERGERRGTWTISAAEARAEEGRRKGHSKGVARGRAFSILTLVNFEGYQGRESGEGIEGGEARAKQGRRQGGPNSANPRPVSLFEAPKEERREKQEEGGDPAETPEAIAICRSLLEEMRKRDPKAKGPTTKKARTEWIQEVERLHRIDGRSWEEIRKAMLWSQGHRFWRTNIRSGTALRRHFERLREDMMEDRDKEVVIRAKKADEEQAARARRAVQERAGRPAETRGGPMPESTKKILADLFSKKGDNSDD
jgi:hypothetical protein